MSATTFGGANRTIAEERRQKAAIDLADAFVARDMDAGLLVRLAEQYREAREAVQRENKARKL